MMEPVTREEKFLASLTGESVTLPDPITRKEMFLAAATGMTVNVPDPITREEKYLSQIKPGDGSGVTIRNQNKTITENGTYKADPGYTGLGTVTVAVPAPDCPAPVLEPLTVTENGEYTPGDGVDGFSRVTVEVEGGGGPVLALSVITKAVNEAGYPTEVDVQLPSHGRVPRHLFHDDSNFGNNMWNYLEKVNFSMPFKLVDEHSLATMGKVSEYDLSELLQVQSYGMSGVKMPDFTAPKLITATYNAFTGCGIVNFNAPNMTSAGNSCFFKSYSLKTCVVPSLSNIPPYFLEDCPALERAELGSVGCGVTVLNGNAFNNTKQTTLTIIIYTTAQYADTVLANARNRAIGATIIIKASENTTYGGAAYAAGDTMITSTVEV